MCLAVPGQLTRVREDPETGMRLGYVDFGGIRREVCLALTPEAQPGDYVLVHVGFAITVIDEAEAKRVFEYLQQTGELKEFEQELQTTEDSSEDF